MTGPEISAYTFNFGAEDPRLEVRVELTCKAGQGWHKPAFDTWAVRCFGRCLNADGEWEYEPLPSSREDDFLARTRWTKDEALRRATEAVAAR